VLGGRTGSCFALAAVQLYLQCQKSMPSLQLSLSAQPVLLAPNQCDSSGGWRWPLLQHCSCNVVGFCMPTAQCKSSLSRPCDRLPAALYAACCAVLLHAAVQGRFQRGLTFTEFVSIIMTEPPRRLS
jgi:hypothetical protein